MKRITTLAGASGFMFMAAGLLNSGHYGAFCTAACISILSLLTSSVVK